MPQIFYIDSDEEIIGAIGRLRHSPDQENFFVFPKRALILQSIINLRLFQKEAQKMGKSIVVVTQDEIGRMLAEKAGIPTETYSDEFAQKANHLELKHQEPIAEAPENIETAAPKEVSHLKSETIGSNSFFTQPPEREIPLPPSTPTPAPEPVVPPQKPVQQLRIRNVTPERPPGLNSLRSQLTPAPVETPKPSPAPVDSMRSTPPAVQSQAAVLRQPLMQSQAISRPAAPSAETPVASALAQPSTSPAPAPQPPQERQSNFLKTLFTEQAQPTSTPLRPISSQKQASVPVVPKAIPPKKKLAAPSPVMHGSARKLFYFFGFISFLSVGLVAAYLFFPKVTVKITPFVTEEKIESSLKGVTSGGEALDSTQVRLLEREIPIKVIGTATDSGSSTTEKARGTIIIYNDFSADPQSLVATTRFETADGKVFRLQKGVTIPGKTSTPGAIEAEVVADQGGESYNIDPTTFTIPGFKGNPKFDTFSAKSTQKMSGGGSGGSEVKSIARADLDKAEADAKTQAENAFVTDLESSRVPGEVFLKETLELTPLDTGSRPREGLTGATFEYERTFKARAFLVQENMLRQKIEAAAQKESNGIRLEVAKIDIDYGEISPNYADSTVGIRIHALVHKRALLDAESMKSTLLGRDASGIQTFLGENPGVQKIELDFRPKWFGSSIPKNLGRVEVVILSE